MKTEIYLTQTKAEAAAVMIDAHLQQDELHNQVRIYIENGKIDFSNGESPRGADDLYKIGEWTLGESQEAMKNEGMSDKEIRETLIESALDQHGLDMVPTTIILADGTEATIWYKGEYEEETK